MTIRGFNKLVHEWIAGQTGGVGSPEWNMREDLVLAVNDLPRRKPEVAWRVIQEVLERNPSEVVLGVMSALLLEDLLVYHGEKFIELVETMAETSPPFKAALGKVWLDSEDTPVWRRVYEIAEVPPPFPENWRDTLDPDS